MAADIPQGRLNECQFTAPREFTPNGTGHTTHHEQASLIRRRIAWKPPHQRSPPTPDRHPGKRSLMRQ
jgi:hypothetical protein